jgi:hypothetical protein
VVPVLVLQPCLCLPRHCLSLSLAPVVRCLWWGCSRPSCGFGLDGSPGLVAASYARYYLIPNTVEAKLTGFRPRRSLSIS